MCVKLYEGARVCVCVCVCEKERGLEVKEVCLKVGKERCGRGRYEDVCVFVCVCVCV